MAITEEQRRQFAERGQQAVEEERARLAAYRRDTRRGADSIDEALAPIPVIGTASGAGARVAEQDQRTAEQRAQAEIDRIGAAPTIDQLTGREYGRETALQLDPSQGAAAQADPLAIAAQRRALEQMQGVADQAGLTSADRQGTQAANTAVLQQQAGQRQAQQAQLRAQGMAGSGNELRAMFGGDQGASAMGTQGAAIQQQAQLRALQALQGTGTVSGQMRGQSFDESLKRGASADDRTVWNALNRQDVGMRNVNAQNQRIDNQRQAYRDRFGIQEQTAALKTGQQDWAGAQKAAAEAASSRRKQNYIAGGAALTKSLLDDEDDDG